MSTGDYFALFDHDDLLHPAALFEVMKAICEQGADFIYTDENTFHNKPEDAYCPHFKPDFAPDTLRSYNYICHLTVFSKNNRISIEQPRLQKHPKKELKLLKRRLKIPLLLQSVPPLL